MVNPKKQMIQKFLILLAFYPFVADEEYLQREGNHLYIVNQ